MQIILLSGGSGTRLWPLSNKARSKQFLKLLPSPNGGSESMLQRVARQLSEAGLDSYELNVATSISQHDAIINQLGESVNVITEPQRRDTFPAIALACSYLKSEKQCADDELVVVMPCDPFTEAGYFSTIARMAAAVRDGVADLVLMGIEPTYPSTKYGYIVPELAGVSPNADSAASNACLRSERSELSSISAASNACLRSEGPELSSISTDSNDAARVSPASEKCISSASISCADANSAASTACHSSERPELSSISAASNDAAGVSPASEKCISSASISCADANTAINAASTQNALSAGSAKSNGGAIVSQGANPLKVNRFTEKPNEEKAHELIGQNAFWNGGVFAFKLGYLLEIIGRYTNDLSFSNIHSHYCELPKISFDYEVVEKAESIAVVPFAGEWKDLGTWNTLCEELPEHSVGNVTMVDCADTHIVNELELPLMCLGVNNLVVAASPDGILISDKAQSEHIKSYADSLQKRPMYEERRWGEYKVVDEMHFADGSVSLTLQLRISAGKSLNYQRHNNRDELWTVLDGNAIVVLDGETQEVSRGDVLRIGRGVMHAVKALSDLRLIEVQLGTSLQQDDVERFPWDW